MTPQPGISGLVFFVVFLIVSAVQPALSSELPAPDGPVLLTVTGNIEHSNTGGAVELDLQTLQQLDEFSFVTDTPWTDHPTKFTGVRVNVLLEYVGAKSSSFKASAIDKYWNELSEMDFERIPMIVAYQRDDKFMRVRDLGPLWLMVPFDDFPELDIEKYKTACVWQLIEIEVH